MRHPIDARAAACLLLLLPASVAAQWPPDGSPLCMASADQSSPVAATDGIGGGIVAWTDLRNGTEDVYVRRVTGIGTPLWTADGVALCTASYDQTSVSITSDGAGGAFVAWRDHRSGTGYDIYAQRVDANGVPLWTADGIAVCAVANNQYAPVLVPDGAGGAIVVWYDYRSLNYDIYAQRVDGDGTLQWTTGGVAVCSRMGNQNSPMIQADGAGGVVVAWPDYRDGNGDIYAQRVSAGGVALWTTNGVPLCVNAFNQFEPVIASDGSKGAIVAWRDVRNGNSDIYAQRIDSTGVVSWTSNGVALCTASFDQTVPVIASDGAGGAIVAWQAARSGVADIYAQRAGAAGSPLWTANGVAVCTAGGAQMTPRLVPDGAGGGLLVWSDQRYGDSIIYSQRIDDTGTSVWAPNGLSMCVAPGEQVTPTAVGDGSGGIVAAWQDSRITDADIFAMRLSSEGSMPTGVGSAPTPAFVVHAAYPNPFATTARIDVVLESPSEIVLDVFDVAGRRVQNRRVVAGEAGLHRLEISARDDGGRPLPGGVYFCRVTAAGSTQTQRLVLIR